MIIEFIPLKTQRKGRPTISFAKSGLISISSAAVDALGISDQAFLSFGKDTDRPKDWYLIIIDSKDMADKGVQVRNKKPKGLSFNASSFVNSFLEDFPLSGGSRSIKAPLAGESEVIFNGKAKAVAIITKAIEQQ